MIQTDQYGERFRKGMAFPSSPDSTNYFLKSLEYIYAAYSAKSMRTYFHPNQGVSCAIHDRSLAELRAYGRASQSPQKYMDILDPNDPDGNRSEGLMNISWANAKFFLKFRDIMYALFQNQFDPTVEALDKASEKAKKIVVGKMKFDRNDKVKALTQMIGVKPEEPKEFSIIESEEDIDLLHRMGGIRLASEILLKDNMDTIFKEDLPSVSEKWVDDHIDLNLFIGVLDFDASCGRPKLHYVDPELAVLQHAGTSDHKDDQVFGYLSRVPISSLASHFKEEEMRKIYDNAYNNRPKVMNVSRKDYNRAKEDNFDDLTTWVLNGYWIDDETQRFVTGMRSNGVMVHDHVPVTKELSARDKSRGKSLVTYNTQYVYKGCLIIGTPFTYNTGKDNLIIRTGKPGQKKAVLPIVVHDGNSESLTGRCIADIDDIQLAILKRRHTISSMIPGPRMAIDKSKMNDDIQIGKKTYSILESAELFPRTGKFIYSSKGEFEDQNGSQSPPITFLPSGITEDITMLISEVKDKLDSIRQQIGINEVSDGSAPTSGLLNGVIAGMQGATNNAMMRTLMNFKKAHDDMAVLLGNKIQTAILTDQMSIDNLEGSGIWGKDILMKSLFEGSFRFGTSQRPTQEKRQLLLADLTQYKNTNMVAPEVYYLVIKMIEDGDLQKAQLFMSKAIARKQKQDHELEIQKLREQAEANGQTGIMVEKARQETMQLEFQNKMQEMDKALKNKLLEIAEEGKVKNELLDKEIMVREMRYNQRV